jgi:hypothetical protein
VDAIAMPDVIHRTRAPGSGRMGLKGGLRLQAVATLPAATACHAEASGLGPNHQREFGL